MCTKAEVKHSYATAYRRQHVMLVFPNKLMLGILNNKVVLAHCSHYALGYYTVGQKGHTILYTVYILYKYA